MTLKRICPYIQCDNGSASKAIALYERALGAKVTEMMRFADAPPECCMPDAQADLVMHAELRIGDYAVMLSDAAPKPAASDGNVQIMLDFNDPAEMAKAFNTLAEGGVATMPIHDAFWGSKFGTLTDAYGVRWMFHCEVK